jgi:uncharacterized protein YceK
MKACKSKAPAFLILASLIACIMAAASSGQFSAAIDAGRTSLITTQEYGNTTYNRECETISEGLSRCNMAIKLAGKANIVLKDTDFSYHTTNIKGEANIKNVTYQLFSGNLWATTKNVPLTASGDTAINIIAMIEGKEGKDWVIDYVPCILGDCESLSKFAEWYGEGYGYNISGTYDGAFPDNDWVLAQTFKSVVGGNLTGIELIIKRNAPNDANVAVSLYDTVADTPSTHNTSFSVLPNLTFTDNYAFYNFTPDRDIITETGKVYAVVVDCLPVAAIGSVFVQGNNPGSYADGRMCWSSNNQSSWDCYSISPILDIAFLTYYFTETVINKPNFETMPNFSVNEDSPPIFQNVTLNCSDVETDGGNLTYDWALNDTTIFSLHIDNISGNATYNFLSDKFGSAEATINCYDEDGNTNSTIFNVVVNSVNDLPVFLPIDNVFLPYDLYNIVITLQDNVSDAETADADLKFDVKFSDETSFSWALNNATGILNITDLIAAGKVMVNLTVYDADAGSSIAGFFFEKQQIPSNSSGVAESIIDLKDEIGSTNAIINNLLLIFMLLVMVITGLFFRLMKIFAIIFGFCVFGFADFGFSSSVFQAVLLMAWAMFAWVYLTSGGEKTKGV